MKWIRLVLVELRKSTDTRASRSLLAIVALLGAGCALLGSTEGPDLSAFVGSALLPLPVLLPIIAVLAATGDWTQRSSLTTFALVPRRGHVLGARLVAAVVLVLAVAASVAAIAFGVFAVLHPSNLAVTDWGEFGATLWSVTALAIASALTGVAMGYLLLNTPLAIAVTLIVPITYDLVISLNLPDLSPWISSLAFSEWLAKPQWSWLSRSDEAIGFGSAVTSFALWTLLPLSAGWIRQLGKEVK